MLKEKGNTVKLPFPMYWKKIESPSGIGFGEAVVGSRGVSDGGRRCD